MKTAITFAKEPCTRCAGTGRHSYCQMHRDVCFKCAGTGQQLTRAGKKARNAYDAFIVEHFTIDARDVVAGQSVRHNGRWYKVLAVKHDATTGAGLDRESGEWVPFLSFEFKGHSLGMAPDARTLGGAILTESAA